MTEVKLEGNLSRRQTLQAAAGLMIAVNLPMKGLAAGATSAAAGAVDPSAYLRIGADDIVTVIVKHVEMGQGPYTGLATLVAEELDADWSRVRAVSAPVDIVLYGGGRMQATGGSNAMASSYELMRRAGAAARSMLVEAAARDWGVAPGEIQVRNGIISHAASKRRGRFGEFAEAAGRLPVPSEVKLKDPSTFRLIGQDHAVKRVDTAAKVNGSAQYTIDINEPGMLTVVIARPPRFGGRPATVDANAALKVKGVVAVRPISNGYAVYASAMWSALKGREALSVTWDDAAAEARGSEQIIAEMLERTQTPGPIASQRGDIEAALAGGGELVETTYILPYLAHAPMEPLDGFIKWDGTSADVRYGAQLPSLDRTHLAKLLGLPEDRVSLTTMLAGGAFGRRGQVDMQFATELAEVARAIGPGKALKIVWTREDDIRGGYYRPAFVHRLRGVVRDGKVVGWSNSIAGHSFVAGTAFAGRIKNGIDSLMSEGASDMPYAVPNFRCDVHTVPTAIPTGAFRSVGHNHTAYAVECFIDQLLEKLGKDPVEGRIELLGDQPRLVGVLKAVAALAKWNGPGPVKGRARGVAAVESMNSFVAEIAEVSLDHNNEPKVHKIWCAVDCGVPVNPDVIRAQMEGGIGFAVGHALYAEVPIVEGAATVSNFADYRSLRITEMPEIDVVIIPSHEHPTGVGEPGVPPAGPAIANALSRLTGSRPTRLPMVRRS